MTASSDATSAAVSNTTPGDTFNLKLESDADPKLRPSHPRNLIIAQDHLIAYGGDRGVISAIPLGINTTSRSESHIIQELDDPVRSVAFSNDGLRVAVGYDTGDIDIYVYDREDLRASLTHPFLSNKKKSDIGVDDSQTSTPDMSQEDYFTQDEDDNTNRTFRVRTGDSAPIRYLSFDPRSKPKSYYLAVATEAPPGFRILNVDNVSTSTQPEAYLTEEAKQAHESGGVRSLRYSPDGSTITTLGMDGRLCFWNVSTFDDPSVYWELLYKDEHKAVPKPDIGENCGADTADRSVCPTWNCDGNILAVPGEDFLQFRRKNGDTKEWLSCSSLITSLGKTKSEIVSIAFDPTDEGYVITSSRDGRIRLWEIYSKDKAEDGAEGRLIADITHNDAICTCAIWHKDANTKEEVLYLAFENASMILLRGRKNIIDGTKRESDKENRTLVTERDDEDNFIELSQTDLDTQPLDDGTESITTKKRLQKISDKTQKDGIDDDDDDDLVFDNNTGLDGDDDDDNDEIRGSRFISDEVDVDDDVNNEDPQIDDVIKSSTNAESVNTGIETSQRDVDVPAVPDDDTSFHNAPYDNIDDDLVPSSNIAVLPEPQSAFGPSSTPISPHRILCWNHIGVITSRTDGPVNVVDISFTDSTSQRPVSFRDNMNFILGSLGLEGGLFASDLMDDEYDDEHVRSALDDLNGISDETKNVVKKSTRKKGVGDTATGSCIYFHRFDTFGPIKDKDWQITLPRGERVLGCASGEGWAAAVTSRHFLRIFTSGGLQGPVIWLKGAPVTITGLGRFVAVFYHESNPLMDGTQKLGYSLYDGLTAKEIAGGSVAAISPKASLTWAGFSSDDSLCIMDSNGMLSMLIPLRPVGLGRDVSWVWIPMLDTLGLKKSSMDTFWPVSVQDAKLIYVLLRGDTQYPDPVRRPITAAHSLRMPLAKGSSGTSLFSEEVSVRANIALEQKKYKNDYTVATEGDQYADNLEQEYKGLCARVDKVSLKLYFSLAKSGKLERALDVTRRLHLEKSFDIAVKAADQLNLRTLSDRILTLQEDKFCAIEDEFVEDDESVYERVEEQIDDEYSYGGTSRVSPDVQDTRGKRKGLDLSTRTRHVRPRSLEVETNDFKELKPRRHNPFAKTRKESPAKTAPPQSPVKKGPTLSRMSTFSAQSRLKSKFAKEII